MKHEVCRSWSKGKKQWSVIRNMNWENVGKRYMLYDFLAVEQEISWLEK